MACIWPSGVDKIILSVDFNLIDFAEVNKLPLHEFDDDGLGRTIATHIYEKENFPVVFMKHLQAQKAYVDIHIDSSCIDIKEWENILIEKYFKNDFIYFRWSDYNT